MKFRFCFGVFVLGSLLSFGLAQSPSAKRPITHKDYDIWNSLQGPVMSPDGKFVAYSVMPPSGDGELIVKNLTAGTEVKFAKGARPGLPGVVGGEGGEPALPPALAGLPGFGGSVLPVFSPDSTKLFVQMLPSKADIEKAKTDKKDAPRQALTIIDLATGKITERIEKVQSFALEGKGAGYLVIRKQSTDNFNPPGIGTPGTPPGGGTPSTPGGPGGRTQGGQRGGQRPGGGAGGTTGPTGTPGTGVPAAPPRMTYGTELVVRNLKDGSERTFADVSEYDVTKDGRELVYVVTSKKEDTNGVYVIALDSQAGPATIRSGRARYSRLTWNTKQTLLVFVANDLPVVEKKPEEKKPEVKKPEEPKPMTKKPEEPKPVPAKPNTEKKLETAPMPKPKVEEKKPEKKQDDIEAPLEEEDQPPADPAVLPVPTAAKYRLMVWDRYAMPKLSGAPKNERFQVSATVETLNITTATELLNSDSKEMPKGFGLTGTGLQFNADGTALAMTLAMLPDPAKPATPAPTTTTNAADKVDLDLWHWKDEMIQPMQKVRGPRGRSNTSTAVYFFDTKQLRKIGEEGMDVSMPARGDWSITSDDKKYLYLTGYGGSPRDYTLVNIRSGEKKSLYEAHIGNLGLSRSGKFATTFDGKDWWTVSIPDGKKTNLTGKMKTKFFSEDFDMPMEATPYGGATWTIDEKFILLSDKYDIWKVAADGSTAENLTRVGRETQTKFSIVGPTNPPAETDDDVRGVDLTKSLLLSATNMYSRDTGFYRLDPGQKPKLLVMGARRYGNPTRAKTSDTYLFSISTFSDYPDYYVSDGNFNEIRRVTNVNPHRANFNWGKAELVHYQSSDGVPLSGILIKPEDFDSSKKYPMMVYIYERLSQNLHSYVSPNAGTSINPTYYASNGYLVFMPDIAYTVGSPGQSALKCVLPAISAVVNQGFVKEDAIGIQGHSWGGYQISYLVTQTNRFKAASAGAPVSDMVSAYGGIRWGTGLPRQFQYERTQSRIGAPLWNAPMKYIENSPIFMADRVQTPLMILHNDGDDAVPWYQGIEYYLALRRLGKECYMFNYNGEPHGLRKKANQRDYTLRMQQFFDYHLKGAAKPEWMEKGIPFADRDKEKDQWKGVFTPEKK